MQNKKINYSISETYLNPPRNTNVDWKITDVDTWKIVLMARTRLVNVDDVRCVELYGCSYKNKEIVWIYINHLILVYGELITIAIPAELYRIIPRLRVLGFKKQKNSPYYARKPEQI